MEITYDKLIELASSYLYAEAQQDSELKLSILAVCLAKVESAEIKKDFSNHCFALVESHQKKKDILLYLCGMTIAA